MASRPAALQIIAGDIAAAQPWGNRLLVEKNGRIVLWDGIAEHDIAPAGHGLQATAFQALIGNAQREDRLVVADGVNPLWYIAKRGGSYGAFHITNKVRDPQNVPYPVPVAQAVATWRGRLWAAFGTNRVQHCQFDDMEYWDPLWTVECQGKDSDRIVALEPHGERLYVGLQHSTWAITGDSHFNWESTAVSGYGAAGPDAMASDKARLYWVSSGGLHQEGGADPISGDIEDVFATPQYPCHVVLDRRRRLLLLLAGGRLFVMHVERPGRFGEITGHQVRGLFAMSDYVGWYGADGAWVLSARDMPDRWLDGRSAQFESLYDTWDVIPNPKDGGRALLTRAVLVALGSARGTATYEIEAVSPEGKETFSDSVTLTDVQPQKWSDKIAGLDGEEWPTPPVRRELAPYVAGVAFRHRLRANCHIEVREVDAKYRFGGENA